MGTKASKDMGAKAENPITKVIKRERRTLESMAIPAESYPQQDSTNLLVIGASNTEKTRSLRTIPRTWLPWDGSPEREFRVLGIDADGRLSVLDLSNRPGWKIISLPINFHDPSEIEATHEDIVYGLAKLKPEKKPDLIFYDSTTPMSENIENYTWKSVAGDEYSRAWDQNEKRYGMVTNILKLIIFGLKANCQFFVLIAHEQEPAWQELKENATKARYKPALIGSIKNLLPKLFQEVYFTQWNDGEWQWLTQQVGQREPRTCYPLKKYIPQDYSIMINRRWAEYTDPGKVKDEKGGENK